MKQYKFCICAYLFLSIIMIASCSKEAGDSEKAGSPIITSSGEAIRYYETQSFGQNGGKTIYLKGDTNAKSSDNSFFLSQFPLVEHRYEIDATYDSIPEFEIDSVSMDTLATQWVTKEISRDTTGFKEGKLWLPFDDRIFTALYVGIEEEEIDAMNLRVRWQLTDDHPSESGLLFRCIDETQKARDEGGYDSCFGGFDSEKQVDDYMVWEKTQIPVFNEMGVITEYSSGIKIPLSIRHFQVNEVKEITRTFTLTVYKISETDSLAISSDFELYFVPKQKHEDRLCWLAQEYACKDYFEE